MRRGRRGVSGRRRAPPVAARGDDRARGRVVHRRRVVAPAGVVHCRHGGGHGRSGRGGTLAQRSHGVKGCQVCVTLEVAWRRRDKETNLCSGSGPGRTDGWARAVAGTQVSSLAAHSLLSLLLRSGLGREPETCQARGEELSPDSRAECMYVWVWALGSKRIAKARGRDGSPFH